MVQDPVISNGVPSNTLHRVCISCYEITNANVPSRFQGLHTASLERIVVNQEHLAVPNTRVETSSQISDLSE